MKYDPDFTQQLKGFLKLGTETNTRPSLRILPKKPIHFTNLSSIYASAHIAKRANIAEITLAFKVLITIFCDCVMIHDS